MEQSFVLTSRKTPFIQVNIMATTKQCFGKFSDVSGTDVRHVYTPEGTLLGVIRKLAAGGYRTYRTRDGKSRDKATLQEAFRTIRRAN